MVRNSAWDFSGPMLVHGIFWGFASGLMVFWGCFNL